MPIGRLRHHYRSLLSTVVRFALYGRVHPLFDADYYRRLHPDVARAPVDPYLHYIANGSREGRNPSEDFQTDFYLGQLTDKDVNPIVHYDTCGWRERLDPNPDFSTGRYLDRYPDVLAANIDPLLHYRNHGRREGRNARPFVVDRGAIPILAAIPSKQVVSLETEPWAVLTVSLLTEETDQLAREFATNFAVCVALVDPEIEQLADALDVFEGGQHERISVHCDGDAAGRPAAPNIVLLFYSCYYGRTDRDDHILVSYGELHVWDRSVHPPRVTFISGPGHVSFAKMRKPEPSITATGKA